MANTALQSNWHIENTLFHPLGLFNNSSETKTIFITWSPDTVITYIFKKNDGGGTVLTDFYEIPTQRKIRSIALTESNALAVLENGAVFYFSSFKNLKRLRCLKRVLCICQSHAGFALIRSTSKNKVFLDLYKDFNNDPTRTEIFLRKFDISYDGKNLFKNRRLQDKFAMISCEVTNENQEFFELLLKTKVTSDEVIFFTINNQLFSLIVNSADESDYEIIVILTLSSEIMMMHFIESRNCLLMILACGTIEIMYESKLSETVERFQYYGGSNMRATAFSNHSFYYSDDFKIVQLDFNYNIDEDTILVTEKQQMLPGIIAFTWVATINKLICLSENNIFYRAKFRNVPPLAEITEPKYFELTEPKYRYVENQVEFLKHLMEEPVALDGEMQAEAAKTELLKIAGRKARYAHMAEVKCVFTTFLPKMEGLVIYADKTLKIDDNSYFLIILMNIDKSKIFDIASWGIYINCVSEIGISRKITVTNDMRGNSFYIVLNLHQLTSVTLPKVQIELHSTISVGADYLNAMIPVKIKHTDISQLFQQNPARLNMPTLRSSDFNQCILRLAAAYRPEAAEHAVHTELELQYKFKTPLTLSFNDVFEWFNVNPTNNKQLATNWQKKMIVYFFGIQISFEYFEQENYILIKSMDANAIFYAKLLLSEKLTALSAVVDRTHYQAAHKNYLRARAALEVGGTDTSSGLHKRDRLNKIYNDLRNSKHL